MNNTRNNLVTMHPRQPAASMSEVKNGLVRIAVVYTGRFRKDDQPFEITTKDLEQIAANLNRREAPIDYEHLSGAAAPPGWSKAAGWIKRADTIAPLAQPEIEACSLVRATAVGEKQVPPSAHVRGRERQSNGRRPANAAGLARDDRNEDTARAETPAPSQLMGNAFRGAYPRPGAEVQSLPKGDASAEGPKALWAWAELTPACLAAVRQKEFRYFSPEIHWNERDEQGRPIGTRLAAGAITNRPFLKDLPPIEISEADYPALLESVALSEALRAGLCATASDGCRCESKAIAQTTRMPADAEQVHVPADIGHSETIKQIPRRPAHQNAALARDDRTRKEQVEMKQFILKKLADGEHAGKIGVFDGDEMIGLCDPLDEVTNDDNYDNADDGDSNEAESQQQMHERRSLTEAVRDIVTDGQINIALAEQRAERGELTMSGFLRAQKIQRLVEEAVRVGKVLPKQRAAFFAIALADYASAAAFLSDAQPVVDLRARGVSGDGAATAKEELEQAVSAYMTEHRCDRVKALTDVSRRNPELWERHKRECGAKSGATGGELARVQ